MTTANFYKGKVMNGCKVTACAVDSIPMGKMRDGDLAIVVFSSRFSNYVGLVVHRHGSTIATVGKGEAGCWPSYQQTDVRVKLLKAGDTLTVC
jgi:hypothetical protein